MLVLSLFSIFGLLAPIQAGACHYAGKASCETGFCKTDGSVCPDCLPSDKDTPKCPPGQTLKLGDRLGLKRNDSPINPVYTLT